MQPILVKNNERKYVKNVINIKLKEEGGLKSNKISKKVSKLSSP